MQKISCDSFSLYLESYTFFFFCMCVVLGFEPRVYTLSHSTSLFCEGYFLRQGLKNYLPGLALNLDPPDLCLLSSWDYRREPPAPSSTFPLNFSLVVKVVHAKALKI
jgi:hypothetical protein